MKLILKNTSLEFKTYSEIATTKLDGLYINAGALSPYANYSILYFPMQADVTYKVTFYKKEEGGGGQNTIKYGTTSVVPASGVTVDGYSRQGIKLNETKTITFSPSADCYAVFDSFTNDYSFYDITIEYET